MCSICWWSLSCWLSLLHTIKSWPLHNLMDNNCTKCALKVTPRQYAVQCDQCSCWQHQKCDSGLKNFLSYSQSELCKYKSYIERFSSGMSGEEYRKLKCSQENFAFLCNKCFDESTIASNLLNKRKRFVNPKYGLTFVKKTQRRNTSNASNAKRLANKQASFTICLSDVRGVISTLNFLLFICFSFFQGRRSKKNSYLPPPEVELVANKGQTSKQTVPEIIICTDDPVNIIRHKNF